MAVVILLVMAVDLLLLCATGRLLVCRLCLWRYVLAALAGGAFAAVSMMKEFAFLGSFLWQVCIILMTGAVAFGISKDSLGRILLFTLLRLSVGGVTGNGGMLSVLLGAVGIGCACTFLGKKSRLIPVQLHYGGQIYNITALYDTGNSLRDPITGKGVLVVDADIARKLTGLEPAALQDPVNQLVSFPGLRLIPYQSIGNSGFLLALHIPDAKIGNRKDSVLVALSPNLLSHQYQALAGGSL